MEIEIDTSGIAQQNNAQPSTWRAPRHVYFGKKGADGMMEDEPVYVHQEYPKMLYKMVGEKLTAAIVNDDEGLAKRTADGWVASPALLGILTAPSFDQIQEMEKAARMAAEKSAPTPTTNKGKDKL